MREELGFMARERFLELPLDLRADLIAAWADGRPDGGEQFLRPRAELLLHAQDGLGSDAAHRALPTAVRDAHRAVDRVEKQDGRAVRKAEKQRQARLIRDQGIRLRDGVRIRERAAASLPAADARDGLAVHLLRRHELRSVEPEGREVAAAVRDDGRGVIPDVEPEVERRPGRFTHTATAARETMNGNLLRE